MLLAISSIVDTRRAEQLLGEVETREAISNASIRGLLAVNERTALFFHPLLRDLLIRRFRETTGETRRGLLDKCHRLLDHDLWDEALAVGEQSLDAAFLAYAVAAALDDLLTAGRSSSLDRWVTAGRKATVKGGLIDYAEAELRLRQGRFDRSIALGGCAGNTLDGDLAARAHLVAARSAHLAQRAKLRDNHISFASELATAPETQADLQWLRFVAANEDENPNAEQLAEELVCVDHRTHDHALRVATANLNLAFERGPLRENIEAAQGRASLVDTASDPYTSTSMLNVLAGALFAAGEYNEALAAAEKEIAIAEEFELPFVIPYAEVNRASSFTAMREFAKARRALRVIEKRVRDDADPFFASQHAKHSAALEIARGNLTRAIDHLGSFDHPRAPKGAQATRLALQSLVTTALGDFKAAEGHADRAQRKSQGLETRALLAAATAIRAAIEDERAECVRAYEEIVESGFSYVLPIAWRARYEVAAVLLESPAHRDAVLSLLFSANDTAIAKRSGLPVPRAASRRLNLSAREQEVCELLAEGRTNQEIATLLFISLSTTKVHVKHILEKLGVRSRVEAARLWEEGH
jgi:DNA-binding CsgD family transcriptional regulator